MMSEIKPMDVHDSLLERYNVAVPRYTSYPTVPYWSSDNFDTRHWEDTVLHSFSESNGQSGVSIYIHLPFCESLCTYCGCNTRITRNHQVEGSYIAAVLEEWHMYKQRFGAKQPLIREIHLGGGTPTFFSPANLQWLISGILEGTAIHPDAEFSFEGHPANTTKEHLVALYQLGFRRVSLGIQDFDPKVQVAINRTQTFDQVEQITVMARKIGYTSVNFDLIYGLPLQTMDSVANTVMLVSELMPDRIAYYSYAHVPWMKPGQRSFTEEDLPGPLAKKKLHELGRRMFDILGYKEVGMDHFALPGDKLLQAHQDGLLHRNFMGYTHQYTQLSIGLGVSAISDSWYAYAQNEKGVEEYLALIAKGVLPIVKGHLLTHEDLIVRRHILDIMCKGSTTWKECLTTSLVSEIIERSQQLVDDGLIVINPGGLTVTQLGQSFLRNICMVFDARLWADKPTMQLFSKT